MLFYSCGVRRDVYAGIVMGSSSVDGSRSTIHIDGSEVRHLRPDERSICCLLQKALDGTPPDKKKDNKIRKTPNLIKSVDKSVKCIQGFEVKKYNFEEEIRNALHMLTQNRDNLNITQDFDINDINKINEMSIVNDSNEQSVPVVPVVLAHEQSKHGPSPSDSPSPSIPPIPTVDSFNGCIVLYLVEDGQPLGDVLLELTELHCSYRTNVMIVLGDDRGLTAEQEHQLHAIIKEKKVEKEVEKEVVEDVQGSNGSSSNSSDIGSDNGSIDSRKGDVDGYSNKKPTTNSNNNTNSTNTNTSILFRHVSIGTRPLLASQCILLTLYTLESIFG